MKKYLFLLLTLVVTSFAFVSCSDDDDDNQYNSAIIGTWKVTEVKTSRKLHSLAFQDNVCLFQI